MGVGAGLYMCDVVKKSSRSLSHLLMSSCSLWDAVTSGIPQGSVLGPLLFVIVMEAISREFRVVLPWELLYAGYLVVIAETEEDLIKMLNEWKDNVENRGISYMRVSMNKNSSGDEIANVNFCTTTTYT